MKKLTAKNLLKEIRALQKQASSGFFKPYPIEYTTQKELDSGIESTLQDILDGYGYMGATNVKVKGDTAYVKGNFELELDIKKAEPPWWEDLGSDMKFVLKLADDVVSKLPKGWSVAEYDIGVWQVVGPGWGDGSKNSPYRNAEQPQAWEFRFPSKSYPGGYVDHGGGNFDDPIWFDDDLTNDYKKDISIIAKHILKEFKKHAF